MNDNTPNEQLDLPLPTTVPLIDWDAKDVRSGLGLLTEEELARALGLRSTTTLATWRAQKTGPAPTKLGKSVFYRVEDVKSWIDRCAA